MAGPSQPDSWDDVGHSVGRPTGFPPNKSGWRIALMRVVDAKAPCARPDPANSAVTRSDSDAWRWADRQEATRSAVSNGSALYRVLGTQHFTSYNSLPKELGGDISRTLTEGRTAMLTPQNTGMRFIGRDGAQGSARHVPDRPMDGLVGTSPEGQ